MNKKYLIIIPVILSLASIVGCDKKDEYDASQFKAEIHKTYQLWDSFDEYDLEVTYKGVVLDPHEYVIDRTSFDSSKTGETKIVVSPYGRSGVKVEIPVTIYKRHSANFLSIGDSFSDDFVYYSEAIANNSTYEEVIPGIEGTTTMNYNFYSVTVSKAGINDHYKYFHTNEEIYTLKMFNSETSTWDVVDKHSNVSLKKCISYTDYDGFKWDFISLQADPIEAGRPNDYSNLDLFSKSILRHLSDQNRVLPTLCFDFTWAFKNNVQINTDYYQYYDNNQITMYEKIRNSVNQEFTSLPQFPLIAPSGTVIQNARTNALSGASEFTTNNGRNLNNAGKYGVGLTLVSMLSGYAPGHFTYTGNDTLGTVTMDEYNLMLRAASSAITSPYEITDLSI